LAPKKKVDLFGKSYVNSTLGSDFGVPSVRFATEYWR
jgi:hypothetical protein